MHALVYDRELAYEWRRVAARDVRHNRERILSLFRCMDANRDGRIARSEFARLVTSTDEVDLAEATRMFDGADLDGNGTLDVREFGELVVRYAPRFRALDAMLAHEERAQEERDEARRAALFRAPVDATAWRPSLAALHSPTTLTCGDADQCPLVLVSGDQLMFHLVSGDQ